MFMYSRLNAFPILIGLVFLAIVCSPGRDFCVLGDLATLMGWKHYDLVKRLEAQRKAESQAFFEKKAQQQKAVAAAVAQVDASS